MNQWRLHVENFGKIAKAKVDVSPFMIFVGKNNSGKSYLMVLLWGILTEADSMVGRHMVKYPEFHEIHNRMVAEFEKAVMHQRYEITIDGDIQRLMLDLFNHSLNQNKDYLTERVFRHAISIGSLRIEKCFMSDIKIQVEKRERDLLTENGTQSVSESLFFEVFFEKKVIHRGEIACDSLPRPVESIMRNIITELICRDFYNASRFDFNEIRQPLYLPASRTGYMHTYRAIVGNLFRYATEFVSDSEQEMFEQEATIQGTEMNLPTIEFLTRLQKRDVNPKRQKLYEDEIHFLNDEVFKGRVITDEKNQVRFIPHETSDPLPLHVTSSLVAEIAPISLFLEASYNPNLWIIEEVESHLHSEMQLTVARLLFRLFNKGNSMWLTTHSDNLAQQINNLLTLSQHPMREQLLAMLNYDEKELLNDLSVIRAYQFETKDGVTEVEELELGKYGFEMKTFNNTLDRLVRETHLIQNYKGESHD